MLRLPRREVRYAPPQAGRIHEVKHIEEPVHLIRLSVKSRVTALTGRTGLRFRLKSAVTA